ncbi:MAG: tRNA (adenosine(37)-N6)-threonylcarbamoyltransferase complex dimerization subunit type 1 TsaB [Clostridia bacterium]|nr:tRNA (adenosine(37)-N6)-threonylcarbamoyltransferase complex dimerization subunit type 1 TsaB [Clostridia bacterium]
MKILALDSTAIVASCAILEDERLLAAFTVNNGNTHSETLLPMVESSLKLLGLNPSDIDLFALSEGPGSFTGVRIGAATIKGLAFGKNKPCIGVSTLEALAHNLIGFNGIICPAMNARRNQVYTALFECKDGEIKRLTEDKAIAVTELEDELQNYDLPIYLCGDGDFLLYESKTRKKDYEFVPEPLRYQSGYSVGKCALMKYNSGEIKTDLTIAPTYLRPSQAERTRNEKIKENIK